MHQENEARVVRMQNEKLRRHKHKSRAERRRDILDTDKTEDTDTSQKTHISSSHFGALPRVLWHRNHHHVRRMLLPPVALSRASIIYHLSTIEQFNSRAVIISTSLQAAVILYKQEITK